MKRRLLGIILAVGAGILVVQLWPSAPPPEPADAPADPPAAPAAESAPVILHPMPAPASAGEPPLPALDESDQAVGEALTRVMGVPALPGFLYPDRMIRRFVATVDNLPRRKLPLQLIPVRPAVGRFAVSGAEPPVRIAPVNAMRYRLQVEALEAMDPAALVDLYVRFYPLFQQAYVELGYPRGYFNDRLMEVLDGLLAAPENAGHAELVRPSVMYKFADADLEALSAGEKTLLRMGEDNARRVKQVLRAIRAELVRRAPAR